MLNHKPHIKPPLRVLRVTSSQKEMYISVTFGTSQKLAGDFFVAKNPPDPKAIRPVRSPRCVLGQGHGASKVDQLRLLLFVYPIFYRVLREGSPY